MTATVLQIRSRHREHMGIITSLADFDCSAGDSMDATSLRDDSRFSLYCLDHDNQRAVFTALPEESDPFQAPFFYQAQFDNAEFLVALPYADFIRIADEIPAPRNLLCLHNIGRCGSTVLSRALNQIDGVLSFSEPDVLASFVAKRDMAASKRRQLLLACVRWLCRPAVIGSDTRAVFKLRNQAAGIMDAFVDALPNARHLFMYRNVSGWLASFYRLRVNRGVKPTRYTRQQIIEQQAAYFLCPQAEFDALAPPDIATYLSLEGRALGWLYMLGRYLDLHQRGANIAAIRYEDLQSQRDTILSSLLDLLGLPESALSQAARAFGSDAQAGTIFARDANRGNVVPLPEEMRATVGRLLAAQPLMKEADLVLPGTILPD